MVEKPLEETTVEEGHLKADVTKVPDGWRSKWWAKTSSLDSTTLNTRGKRCHGPKGLHWRGTTGSQVSRRGLCCGPLLVSQNISSEEHLINNAAITELSLPHRPDQTLKGSAELRCDRANIFKSFMPPERFRSRNFVSEKRISIFFLLQQTSTYWEKNQNS